METLHIWDTEYSADSVEWCPVTQYQNIFVCGTYQLAENKLSEIENDESNISANHETSGDTATSKSHNRLGRLYLFAIDSSKGLNLLQSLEMPAILDTKWCHCEINGKILLAVANAVGDVELYELCTGRDNASEWHSCKLDLLCKHSIIQDVSSETLALSLDWSTARNKIGDAGRDPAITVSDSTGHISVLKLTDFSLEKTQYWKAHEFEAWITAFDYWNPSLVYTGGDDCRFHVYDLRAGTRHPMSTSRVHEAGVTSLHSNAVLENILASGSYDENLRIWDTRHMKRPQFHTSLKGGVWRLKWDPHRWQHLVAACMHGGFCVVDCNDNTNPPVIVATYGEHQSLAYGSDWCHLISDEVPRFVHNGSLEGNDTTILATCSFYDHKLCVSAINKLSLQ
ncbi:diphthine methyltransferase [Periplaneta americana]|uniref:diphthine methyltransferase n=1 Tax=Periplaneta americana TaxID=6978 RepID=UPI0037E7C5CC